MITKIKKKLANFIYGGMYAPGHFYNPIPRRSELRSYEAKIFADVLPHDIDLNAESQIDFLRKSSSTYQQFPYVQSSEHLRYSADNEFFNVTDAISLYLILNHFRPRRVIEVGSGYSSAVLLDTVDDWHDFPDVTLIEPFPARLISLLKKDDFKRCCLLEERIQFVDLALFETLEAGDLLFIDTSHISKAGSDVNHIIFNVLPLLAKGVVIHFHDICYPFEYPKEWIYNGVYWNEAYMLKAFLMNNVDYEILLFNHYLAEKHRSWLKDNLPLFISGGSLYIRKK